MCDFMGDQSNRQSLALHARWRGEGWSAGLGVASADVCFTGGWVDALEVVGLLGFGGVWARMSWRRNRPGGGSKLVSQFLMKGRRGGGMGILGRRRCEEAYMLWDGRSVGFAALGVYRARTSHPEICRNECSHLKTLLTSLFLL